MALTGLRTRKSIYISEPVCEFSEKPSPVKYCQLPDARSDNHHDHNHGQGYILNLARVSSLSSYRDILEKTALIEYSVALNTHTPYAHSCKPHPSLAFSAGQGCELLSEHVCGSCLLSPAVDGETGVRSTQCAEEEAGRQAWVPDCA